MSCMIFSEKPFFHWPRLAAMLGGVLMLTLLLPAKPATAAMPYVTADMEQAQYWVDRLEQPDAVVLNPEEIRAWNERTRSLQPSREFDLADYPERVSGATVIAQIQEYTVPDSPRYAGGSLLAADYFRRLEGQRNVPAVPQNVTVQYGVTCARAMVRSFPTADFAGSTPGEREFDLFQETALDPGEPVIILHQSTDAAWHFVQAYNYRGWVAAAAVGMAANRAEWLNYWNHPGFLVVTGSRLDLAGRQFAMGAKLMLAEGQSNKPKANEKAPAAYLVKIPERGPRGELYFTVTDVKYAEDVSKGYLPYTRANVIRQAFKMKGEPYGWGGLFEVRDCSTLILDTYRSFGLMMPRNADEQEAAAGLEHIFPLNGSRKTVMQSLLPGATLHMSGHVMLYIGEQNGRYYIIHALGARGGTREVAGPVMRVVVSDVSLTFKSSGKSFLDVLTVAKQP
ncbi:MAG TPA: SH3 domain-containing protein [Patescibacteria group bacterium]|nr:SH3 domain-containing protein [Patescibacteria group bacterium]